MGKKVLFYLMLDSVGVGIAFLIRWGLLSVTLQIQEPSLQSILIAGINIVTVAACLFILFFFLLYWLSERKWNEIKQRFSRRKTK